MTVFELSRLTKSKYTAMTSSKEKILPKLNLLLDPPPFVRLLCTHYLCFQDVLSLDTATHKRLIVAKSCPLWVPQLTFRSRWELKWAIDRYVRICVGFLRPSFG